MQGVLELKSQSLTTNELQMLTEELCDTLREEAGLNAMLATRPAEPGEKGVGSALGRLVVDFAREAATPLLNAIGSFLVRSRELEVTLIGADGSTFTVKSKNVSADERGQTLADMNEFLARQRGDS